MRPRASSLVPFVGVMLAMVAPCRGAAEEPLFSNSSLVTADTDAATKRGLQFLADKQLDDGSLGTRGNGRNVAVVGLAALAFLAAGSTPGEGEFGDHIDGCIQFLLENISDVGLIATPDSSTRGPMYGHGFATLFLAEVHGMSRSPQLRERLHAAVQLIVTSQNDEGGWRYDPVPRDADLSVTVCQVMALRAARNAGISVPKETIERSIAYVKNCQNSDGGFRYMLAEGPPGSGFARTAAGVVALYNAGIYDGPELAAGLKFLDQHRPSKESAAAEAYYFYAHYYAVQAMWHAGGERWKAWYPAIRDQLVDQQRSDGSWIDPVGPEYATAMACIILQTPNNYLPILQR